MTVAQILAALEQISERADRLSREAELVSPDYLAMQVSEIGRIADLTRDLIGMEGLQLLEQPGAAT